MKISNISSPVYFSIPAKNNFSSTFIKNLYSVNQATSLNKNDIPRIGDDGKFLSRRKRQNILYEKLNTIENQNAFHHSRNIRRQMHIAQKKFNINNPQAKSMSRQSLLYLTVGTYLSLVDTWPNITAPHTLTITNTEHDLITQDNASAFQHQPNPDNADKHRHARSIGIGEIRPLAPVLNNYKPYSIGRLTGVAKITEPISTITEMVIDMGGFQGADADKVKAVVKTVESFLIAAVPYGIQIQAVTYGLKATAELMEDNVSPENKVRILEEGQTFFQALRTKIPEVKSVRYPNEQIMPDSEASSGNKNQVWFRAEGKASIPAAMNFKTHQWEVPQLQQAYRVKNFNLYHSIRGERGGIVTTMNNEEYLNVIQDGKSFFARFKTNHFGQTVIYNGASDYIPVTYNSAIRRWEPQLSEMKPSLFPRIAHEELIKEAGIVPHTSEIRIPNSDQTITVGSTRYIVGDECIYPVKWEPQFKAYVVNVQREGLTIPVPIKYNPTQKSWKPTVVQKIKAEGKGDTATGLSKPKRIKTEEETIPLASTSTNYVNPSTITIPLKGVKMKDGLHLYTYNVIISGYTKSAIFDANYNVWTNNNKPILRKPNGEWEFSTREQCAAQVRADISAGGKTKTIILPAIKPVPMNATPVPKNFYYVWIGGKMPLKNQQNIAGNANKCWDSTTNSGYRTTLMVDPDNPEVLTELINNLPNVSVKNVREEPFFHDFKSTDSYELYTAATTGKGGSKAAGADVLRLEIIKKFGGIYLDADDIIEAPVAHVELKATPEDILLDRSLTLAAIGSTNDYGNNAIASHAGNPIFDAISKESYARFSKNKSIFDQPRPVIGDNPGEADTAAMNDYIEMITETTGLGPFNTVLKKERPYLHDFNMMNIDNKELKSVIPPDTYIHQSQISQAHHLPFHEAIPIKTGNDHSWTHSK